MAGSLGGGYVAGLRQSGVYVPICVASLRLDTVTDFDLFIQPGPDQTPVLYRERNLPFTEEVRRRLEETRVERLFIDSGQDEEYRRYVESNMGAILTDETVPVDEKCEMLYMSAQGLVREIMEDPTHGDGIRRSKGVVHSTIDFMFEQTAAFAHLLTVTSHNYHTFTHSVNVLVYSMALALRLGYQDLTLLREFGEGTLLHDIGKGVIDPTIVNCTSGLTDAQWRILKRHPLYGYDLLDKPGGLGETGLDVVRHHHEKLSGRGYPDRLTRTRITPLARIIAITDCFDALTTRRPYRAEVSSFRALRIMKTEMADDLDPEYFRAFVMLMGSPG